HLHLLSFPTRRSSDLSCCCVFWKRRVCPIRPRCICSRCTRISSSNFTSGIAGWASNVPRSTACRVVDQAARSVIPLLDRQVVFRSEEHTSELQSRRDL